VAAAVALAGCGGERERNVASTTAVKVNDGEISIHQLDHALARAPQAGSGRVDEAGALAIERLIDQELMAQKATNRRLDRDPTVIESSKAARREILARAYLEQVTGQAPPPSEGEIRAFYADNPSLFARRRIYTLQELGIGIAAERFEALRVSVDQAEDLQAVIDWLGEQGIPFSAGSAVRAAEQLPLDSLEGIARLEDGQSLLTRVANGALLVHLAASREEPLDEAAARPFIKQFLANRKKVELARAELEHLRDSASIEYVGDFAGAGPGDSPSSAAPTLEAAADAAPPPPRRDDAVLTSIEIGCAPAGVVPVPGMKHVF
jgi:EpsD family peptidyl-prolyl cis-trans isomerase